MPDPHADCNQFKPLLDAFHDGELEAQERAAVEAHLKLCDACRRELAGISFVAGSLRQMPPVALKRDLSGAIESRLATANSQSNSSPITPVGQACLEMQPLLDAFHDGELAPAEHEKVSEHLGICEDCRQGLAEIGRIVVSLKNLSVLKPRRDLAENFEEVLARETTVVQLKQRTIWGSIGVAAAVAAIVLALHPGPIMAPGTVTVGANQPAKMHTEIAVTPQNTLQHGNNDVQPAEQNGSAPDNKQSSGANVNAKDDASAHSAKPAVQHQTAPAVAQNQLPAVHSAASTIAAPADGTQIADAQVSAVKQQNGTVVALYDGGANSAEELGITTDEDGLYAIKL